MFCSKCRRNFATKKGLDNHVAKNTCKHKSVRCDCGKWFVNARGQQLHLKRTKVHPVNFPGTCLHQKQLVIKRPELRCHFNAIDLYCGCGRIFKSEVNLKTHLKKCTFLDVDMKRKKMMLHW